MEPGVFDTPLKRPVFTRICAKLEALYPPMHPFRAGSVNANNTTGYTWRKVAKLLPPFTTQADVQLQLAA